MSTVFKDQYDSTPLQGANATYVEWLYEQFLAEPGSVPTEWRRYFGSLGAEGAEIPHSPIVQAVGRRLRNGGASAAPSILPRTDAAASEKQARRRAPDPGLQPARLPDGGPRSARARGAARAAGAVVRLHGTHRRRHGAEFFTGGLASTGGARMRLQDISQLLKRIYCGKLAAEFAHISRASERLWLREQLETCRVHGILPGAERRRSWTAHRAPRASSGI